MIVACSHVTLTSTDVPRSMRFLETFLGIAPRYANDEFGEFVLNSGFRIAVFAVLGKTREYFNADGERGTLALGVTTRDVDGTYALLHAQEEQLGLKFSGPPKAHAWGEKSFLLIDPDGNRWEVAQAPSPSHGMLVDRD
jgi:catechol 2,3-dioxygenase-like lactoylglutathione lyase family enzyme